MSALDRYPPTRTAALERLSRFVPRAGSSYARLRNFDLPGSGHPHVSGLSPYLRHRLITESEVLDAVLGRHGPKAAEKFVQEVFWRTYWKGWLELRPGIWTAYKAEVLRALDDIQTQDGLRSGWEVRRLGAGAGRDRLSAQSRADVVRLDLDLHPRPALAAGRGFLPAPPARRRPGLEHAGLALGGGAAHARQGLCRAGGEHRALYGRAVTIRPPGRTPPTDSSASRRRSRV
jgi:hypothetical protein